MNPGRNLRDVRNGCDVTRRGTPTAFRLKAQGCAEGATLGNRWEKITTPAGLRPFVWMRQIPRGQNPIGVHECVGRLTQGSPADGTTLGFEPERRWRSAAPGEILKSLGQLEAEIIGDVKEREGMLK